MSFLRSFKWRWLYFLKPDYVECTPKYNLKTSPILNRRVLYHTISMPTVLGLHTMILLSLSMYQNMCILFLWFIDADGSTHSLTHGCSTPLGCVITTPQKGYLSFPSQLYEVIENTKGSIEKRANEMYVHSLSEYS